MTHSQVEIFTIIAGFSAFLLFMILVGVIIISEDIKKYIKEKE